MTSAAASVATEDFVQGEVLDGGLAVITLARPKALNAMNLDMDRTYTHLLDSWQKDSSIKAVLIQGSTPRAFCSGADVKWFATAIRDDPATSVVEEVFNQEYPLVVRIARYPKPYISIMDGITMGFGLGLSGHGKYRVITERTVVAMPENGIGLFPDVGFAHLVGRAPRGLGTYMALTGARLKTPADIFYAGLASHFVPSEKLPELKADLQSAVRDSSGDAHAAVEAVLERFASPPGEEPSLKHAQPFIERVFGAGHPVTQIQDEVERAESSGDSKEAEWAAEALAGLRRGGPVSLAVTQKHFDAVAADAARGTGELSTIEGVMRVEYRLALRTSRRPDFVEGVRAVLIDKDQKPRWQPSTLDAVKAEDVDKCFAPFDSAQDELHV
ncbi:3-hydroxyisobutyryl-CoA hydrolase-like protein 3 [Klebsormidium nitens]|uniref:3-hydroxyisobutyryl-CoA hydrolase n=1 Tax=Klebsormidium nitens TaxID=105231 RepID=A0A0U9HUN9_KLENI|nr:3-hydroxyisobutyryl-CoA hydrolase-like protein 3 [Klebsormidium nitens]|eukprot:GAQ82028.1 3-hydroxyisobutyryl-CoA hydrolase-like protein 3 [Klebsormidium nitens]